MTITAQGIQKSELDTLLRAVDDLADELRADATTISTGPIPSFLSELDGDTGVTDTNYESVLGPGGSGDAWPASPSSAALNDGAFTSIDMSQEDMVTFIQAAGTLLNELRTDRATMATSYDALLAKLDADTGVDDDDYASTLGVGGTEEAWPANPSASAIDTTTISDQGVTQVALYNILSAIVTLGNELRTDRATIATSFEALLAKLDLDAGVGSTDYEAKYGIGGYEDPWPANPSSAALSL